MKMPHIRQPANGGDRTTRQSLLFLFEEMEQCLEIDGASASLAFRSGSVHSSRCGFSVERLNQTQAVHCKDLQGHLDVIRAIEFSNDGSLLVSGGDQPVLIWRMDQIVCETQQQPIPSVLKVQPRDFKLYFDNSRIFAGGQDQSVYVLDAQT